MVLVRSIIDEAPFWRWGAGGRAPAESARASEQSGRGSSFGHLLGGGLFGCRFRRRLMREMLVELPAGGDVFLGEFQETFGFFGVALGEHGVAGFVVDEILERDAGGAAIELEAAFFGVEAEERPVAGIDGGLLLIDAEAQVVAVGDAVAVGDDEARAIVGFGFEEGFDAVHVAGAHGDLGDVDAAIADGHHGEVFFAGRFTAGGELGDGAARCGLGGLAAGVGVDFGVEHEDVDVAAAGEDVIEAAVADVVGPTVAADYPDGFLDERVGEREQVAGFGRVEAGEALFEDRDAAALGGDAFFGGLVGVDQVLGERFADLEAEFPDQLAGVFGLFVGGEPHAEAELGVVLEQRIAPGGTAAFGVDRVGRGGEIAAVDGGAAGGVGDQHAVAEELRHEFDVRGFAAARAGARKFEERLHELDVFHLRGGKNFAIGFG